MPTIGGNTIKASAGMNAAETRFQRVKGIEDSKELFYQETLKGGKNKNDPQLLRASWRMRRKPLSGCASRHYA
jgi:fumarate reductase flavoprotein subunit